MIKDTKNWFVVNEVIPVYLPIYAIKNIKQNPSLDINGPYLELWDLTHHL